MALYEYECDACGPFEADRPMAECRLPHACPECGSAAPRVMLTAPRLASMAAGTRQAHATNERSAHEPKVSGHRHGPGCGCGAKGRSAATPAAAKSFPGKRPWMISH